MDYQQGLDFGVDGFGGQRNQLDVEVALQFIGEHPGFGTLPRHRVEALAHDRQRAHQAEHRPLGDGDARDGAREVVLEQALALRRDRRDRLLAIELAHGQAEVELFARKELLRLDAVELRRVLVIAVGLRVVEFDHQVAAGDRLELAREVLDALREAAQLHRHRLLAARNVELYLDRRFQAAQQLLRALRKCLDFAFRQVDLHRLERHQVIGGNEDQEQRGQADRGVGQRFVLFHGRVHRLRSAMLVANSEKPITERK